MTNNKFLEDKNGNRSSKRLWGSILLSFALILSLILFIFSIYENNYNYDSAEFIITTLFSSGTLLIGVGTFEKKHDN